ncbi:MAG: DUF4275 family protein [Candidatus Galacturonibacter soehngenii]|nr:DUF4275 family protein [Candidatus Galacturonibacter soehngenii]
MIKEFGKIKIDVDVEATKKYYSTLQVLPRDIEAWNNYCLYLEKMKPEEKSFFEELGILPHKCDIESLGYNANRYYPIVGMYLIKGSMIQSDKEDVVNDSDKSAEDAITYFNMIEVGRFSFRPILKNVRWNGDVVNIEEGFVCIEVFSERFPWVLPEKPNHTIPEPANWWHPVKKVKEVLHDRKMNEKWKQETLQSVIWDLKEQNIPFHVMKKSQVNAFKNAWIYTFAPEENIKKAKKVCYPEGFYLWHMFSYEYAKCKTHENALKAFYKTTKEDCYLYLSYFNVGIKIRNADRFEWKNKDLYEDFVMTDKDFCWTFAKTHEEECGPYFLKLYSKEEDCNVIKFT